MAGGSPLFNYLMFGQVGGGAGDALGASFDGTNDYLLRGGGLATAAAGSLLIIAMRFRMNGGDGVLQTVLGSSGSKLAINRQGSNVLRLFGRNAAGTDIILVETTVTVTTDGDYHTLLVGIDMADQSASLVYLDDVDVTGVPTVFVNDSIGFATPADWSIGAGVTGGTKLNSDINFLYANFSSTLDFSVEANRRKFFDASGDPVINPNGNGAVSGLTNPIIYLAGDYESWHTNKGIGGGFTEIGELTRPLP